MCLIRKLLVLDPQQRLAAAAVLEALSATIASWCVGRAEQGLARPWALLCLPRGSPEVGPVSTRQSQVSRWS